MTIKEAFEKLVDTTAAAMKNPFFVMRKLHSAFVDIADKIEGGGGGSTVEVTQVVSTGTKIATITVDDSPTDLYAPAPYIPISYSTNEQDTGLTWIDGKKIYQKTFVKDSTDATGTTVSIDASALNIDKCVNIFGTFNRVVTGTGTLTYMFNCFEGSNLHAHLTYADFNKNINFGITLFTGEATSEQHITILYTKAS